jgi:hypothetical protein
VKHPKHWLSQGSPKKGQCREIFHRNLSHGSFFPLSLSLKSIHENSLIRYAKKIGNVSYELSTGFLNMVKALRYVLSYSSDDNLLEKIDEISKKVPKNNHEEIQNLIGELNYYLNYLKPNQDEESTVTFVFSDSESDKISKDKYDSKDDYYGEMNWIIKNRHHEMKGYVSQSQKPGSIHAYFRITTQTQPKFKINDLENIKKQCQNKPLYMEGLVSLYGLGDFYRMEMPCYKLFTGPIQTPFNTNPLV